ncbi:hypothetical protein [Catenulispora yoronensis]
MTISQADQDCVAAWCEQRVRWHLRDEFPATSEIQTLLDIVADPRNEFE